MWCYLMMQISGKYMGKENKKTRPAVDREENLNLFNCVHFKLSANGTLTRLPTSMRRVR